MDKADSKEKVIKDWAIKNQMFDAGSNRRASRRRRDDDDSSGGEQQPPRPNAKAARGKAKGKAKNTQSRLMLSVAGVQFSLAAGAAGEMLVHVASIGEHTARDDSLRRSS